MTPQRLSPEIAEFLESECRAAVDTMPDARTKAIAEKVVALCVAIRVDIAALQPPTAGAEGEKEETE